MKRARALLAAGLLVASCLAAPPAISWLSGAESLPDALTDQEFWKLSAESSEEGGFFRSDNLLSNEMGFPFIVTELTRTPRAARVYMGVGPEQNFNYIAALNPKMAFIVDVRRGNLDVQLMYKALFELSEDRTEFVSRLFSRARPQGLTAASTVEQIFRSFDGLEKNEELKAENLLAIKADLVARHHFDLTSEDLQNITAAYDVFYRFGPDIRYSSSQGGGGFGGYNQPTYAELMTAPDAEGHSRSYLTSEASFQVLKSLETRNLIVPVVGNFGGPKAIRAVGQYVREHGSIVSAFYLSNVEMYLAQQDLWQAFCRNVATLPLDDKSTFIRSSRGGGAGGYGRGFGLSLSLSEIAPEVKDCQ